MSKEQASIKLTQYSHGAGCGCKISPKILNTILADHESSTQFEQLIVGNDTRDDAAVLDLGDGSAVISTTDFFMPIVDDGFDFGHIASVNAISDIYAMGGQPIMAIAILGWPIDKLPAEAARPVIAGARHACHLAGIPLAGGHSIDCPEPIFGLAVTGKAPISHIKRNNTAQPGDLLYLTKPLGVGILSTAQKRGLLKEEDARLARDSMITLNSIGAELGKYSFVHAMTDVTGFGLLGHLTEICQGSQLSAEIHFDQIPLIPSISYYLDNNAIPGGTHRNWDSYGEHIGPLSDRQRYILCDPQTSGGLMIAVNPHAKAQFHRIMNKYGHQLQPFGQLYPFDTQIITVK